MNATPAPLLSVIIPTRHEAATIESFLARLFLALGDIRAEVVVVDDSDRDNTVELLHQEQRRVGERLVVAHRPAGRVPERTLGTAVVEGMRLAQGQYLCVMDADGQHPPEIIPEMLALAQSSGADYVGASRYIPGGSADGLNGLGRKAISRSLALFTRVAFPFTPIRRMTDPLSGFFLVPRQTVDGVDLRPIGWKISLEVLARGRCRQVAEAPYCFAARADGASKASAREGLQLLRHIAALLLAPRGSRGS
jgi:dolichol-phosphate mannosyltransferase